jgi:hypothetical protein
MMTFNGGKEVTKLPQEGGRKASQAAIAMAAEFKTALELVNEHTLHTDTKLLQHILDVQGEGGPKSKPKMDVDYLLAPVIKAVDAVLAGGRTAPAQLQTLKPLVDKIKEGISAAKARKDKEKAPKLDVKALATTLSELLSITTTAGTATSFKDMAEAMGAAVPRGAKLDAEKLAELLAEREEEAVKAALASLRDDSLKAITRLIGKAKKSMKPKKPKKKKSGEETEEEEEEESEEEDTDDESKKKKKRDTTKDDSATVVGTRKLVATARANAVTMGTNTTDNQARAAELQEAVRRLQVLLVPNYVDAQEGGGDVLVQDALAVTHLRTLKLNLKGYGPDATVVDMLHDERLLGYSQDPLKATQSAAMHTWFNEGGTRPTLLDGLAGTLAPFMAVRLLQSWGVSPYTTPLQWEALPPSRRALIPANFGAGVSTISSMEKAIRAQENKLRGSPVATGQGFHGQLALDIFKYLFHAVAYSAEEGSKFVQEGKPGATRSVVPYPYLLLVGVATLAGGMGILSFTPDMIREIRAGSFLTKPVAQAADALLASPSRAPPGGEGEGGGGGGSGRGNSKGGGGQDKKKHKQTQQQKQQQQQRQGGKAPRPVATAEDASTEEEEEGPKPPPAKKRAVTTENWHCTVPYEGQYFRGEQGCPYCGLQPPACRAGRCVNPNAPPQALQGIRKKYDMQYKTHEEALALYKEFKEKSN